MRLFLKPHPDTPCAHVESIDVSVHRSASGELTLTYILVGDTRQIVFPELQPAMRRDGLWAVTCFEAFLDVGDGTGYLEFNFSPSTEWAAYRFNSYRNGMAPLESVGVRVGGRDDGTYGLIASIELADTDLLETGRRLGLSAVIELKDGSKSYWALAHAPGPPDFHHPDGFAATLPPESP